MMNTKGLGRNRRVQVSTGRLARLSLLAASIFSIQTTAFALQELSDQSLRQVDGQDGVVINTAYDSIHFDSLYWEDKAGATGTNPSSEITLRHNFKDVNMTGTNQGAKITVNAGANAAGTTPALSIGIVARPSTINVKESVICNGATCGPSMGNVTIQATQDTTVNLKTINGFFNSAGSAQGDIFLRNLNIYLTQAESATVSNQIILKDFNFNFSFDGHLFVSDKNGFTFETRGATNFVNLQRVTDPIYTTKTQSGINIELMMKSGLANPVPASDYNLTGAKGMIRLGASGLLTNTILNIRGVSANGLDNANNILGFVHDSAGTSGSGANATVLGSTGIVARFKTDFVGSGSDQLRLELGHAGDNAYGIEFGQYTQLLVRQSVEGIDPVVNPNKAYFDSGSVYLNLANTQRLQLPTNTVLNNARFRTATLTAAADYSQDVVAVGATSPNAFVLAIRGAEVQALSRTGRFIVSNNVTNADDIPSTALQTWGLALPIYNLNGNIAMFGTTPVAGEEKLGFSIGMTTEGVNAAGDKTTSILLIDGAPNVNDSNKPVNYYVGLRNIDMLMKANGTLSLKRDAGLNGKLNFNIQNFMIAASAQMSAGYLPGARYNTADANGNGVIASSTVADAGDYVPTNNFAVDKDVLFGVKVRLAGSANLDIVPATQASPTLAQNQLGFEGQMTLVNSAIQISDPFNGSIWGLDNINGTVNFSNKIKVNKSSVDFNSRFDFNKTAVQATANTTIAASALRVKDFNLYPPTSGAGQRLGEFAMPGGTLTAKFNIKPR